ncbi:hypothetical protein BGW36DRAFT_371504 [Talaromyces proteolyticus]|uniref:Uncharacterized protein n=1 Tax=Talaromyces proteolyticus TaxID=1131652 RepID=A0AAD4L0B0_9EURO|nr:uncharacterized protein BGW36DRAFT_371504 [Talaromyces proteolyticus]KAH8701756.1 hypothetical protein BGW36DRAFT_371504 [Talaromyces proteolyticus]
MNHLIEEQDRHHASSSTFPHFDNGDVLFYIPPSQIWNLHADVLRRCSPGYMGSLLAPHHAAQLIKAAEKAGTKTRYRLELVPSHGNPNGVFIRKVRGLVSVFHINIEALLSI